MSTPNASNVVALGRGPARLSTLGPREELIGDSTVMRRLRDEIEVAAAARHPVMIIGATGSGKELVARAVHQRSLRADAPWIDLNCAGIPESLADGMFFGHRRGSFTDAREDQEGYFRAVGRGTIFFDEIAEMPQLLQAKLLRVLEGSSFRALGSTQEHHFEGRITAAAHSNLWSYVHSGRFREDLLYRLETLVITVPTLAERTEDIPLLATHFARAEGIELSDAVLNALSERAWPGNVRQLRNIVARLSSRTSRGDITVADVSAACGRGGAEQNIDHRLRELVSTAISAGTGDRLRQVEQLMIAEAMERAKGNKTEAARLLGVNRKTIERRSRKQDPSFGR